MSKAKHNRTKRTKSGHKIISSHNDWKKRAAHAKEQIRLQLADAEAERILKASGVNLLSGVKNLINKTKEKFNGKKSDSNK
jgi:hypothetical protein